MISGRILFFITEGKVGRDVAHDKLTNWIWALAPKCCQFIKGNFS